MNGGGCFVSHLYAQLAALRRDGQRLVSQLAGQVEGLARRLLQRQPARVLCDGRLDSGSYLRRGPEETVCWYQARYPLVRPAEVVAIDEERESSLAVGEVGKDGAAEEFIPQRLPEALRLPQCLWMVWPALQVGNALPLQLGLEFSLPAPRRVLPPVVGQHLTRHAKCRQPTLEGLHHQLRLLPVRHRVADDEAAVVIHEDGDVQPLVAPQQEAKDVRLPHLVWLGALEARLGPWRLLDFGRPRLEQALFVKNSAHRRL